MDTQLKNVLEAVLKMLKALSEHVNYLKENDSLTDHSNCWLLVDDIRITCINIMNTMNQVERRIHAAALRPPKEE